MTETPDQSTPGTRHDDDVALADHDREAGPASPPLGFRAAIEDRLQHISDPREAVCTTCEALGHRLGVGQVAYAEVEPGDDAVLIELEWNDGSMNSNAGRHRLDDFGPPFITDLKRGQVIAIDDVRLDPRTSAPLALETFAKVSIRAFLNIPIVKADRLVAVLAVHSAEPRAWTRQDVALAAEIAEQTWATAERARGQSALKVAEERYLALFNAIDQGFCTIEVAFDDAQQATDYRFLEVSPSFEAQTGIVDGAGRWMREIAPDQDRRWFDLYGQVALSGDPLRFEDYSTPLDRWWSVYAFRISGHNRVAVLFRDITDQKRAEAALRQSEARLRQLNDTLEHLVEERTQALRLHENIVRSDSAPICAFDTEFRLTAFNQAHNDEFRRVNGFDTCVGDVFPELFIPEQRPVMRTLMARALAGERFTVVEEFGKPELGRPYWEITYTPLRDDAGRIIGAFHHANDITERLRAQDELAQAQEQLRQSQKMEAIGQLTGGVAHDFNNLLTPIVGALDILQRRDIGEARDRKLIQGAAQSADRARVLVQRLLAFARRQPLKSVAVDVPQLVQGIGELVASTIGPQIRLDIDLPNPLSPALADPHQLEMALLNLSVNARDAMPAGGVLSIAADERTVREGEVAQLLPGAYIRLCVTDTGTGMDADTLSRAVDPFFSTKGIGQGTGLGLSMVHGLASQLGGGLTISSQVGKGTTVELWLPRSHVPIQADERRAPVQHAKARGLALLIDDEANVRLTTGHMLNDIGYQVIEADSAETALDLIESGLVPDVVITDHLMPGMTGAELALRFRSQRPALPVLIVSGYAEKGGIEAGLPRLTKPFRREELETQLAMLGQPHTILSQQPAAGRRDTVGRD